DQTVTSDKLGADPTDEGKVGVVQSDGTIVYQNLSSDNVEGKDLTAEDNSIVVTDGTGATLVDAQVKVADGGISTDKLAADAVTTDKIADGAVTNAKVGADAITSDKIKDGEVQAEDLGADGVDAGKVATADGSGNVTYETPSVDAGDVENANDLTTTGIITINGATTDLTGALLKDA